MLRVGRILLDPAKQGSSMGRKIFRGIALGGLVGGVLGLAIELAPEESWPRRKADELIAVGHEYFQTSQPKGKIESLVRLREEPPKLETSFPLFVPEKIVEEVVESQVSTENEEDVETKEDAHASTEESIDTPQQEETTEHVGEQSIEEDLRERVKILERQLEKLKNQYDSDMAQAAGAAEAMLDKMDRMYVERETAISTAKQGLLVNELLAQIARDRAPLSGGALRVSFQESFPELVSECFAAPEDHTSFFKLALGKILAALYSPSAGLPSGVSSSPTCMRLHALQEAATAVQRGDFLRAVHALEKNQSAQEWSDKARQAMQVWQGAEAAIASMHEDLSRVL